MEKKIEVSVVGFGKLGKKVLEVSEEFSSIKVVNIYSRREEVEKTGLPVYNPENLSDLNRLENKKNRVAIICNSSKTLIEEGQLSAFGTRTNNICTLDDHPRMLEQLIKQNKISRERGTVSIFTGWDPGLFSKIRSMFATLFPKGEIVTFWGPGSSRGHADKILEEIDLAEMAKSYTQPVEEILGKVKKGKGVESLDPKEIHERIAFVSLKEKVSKTRKEEIREEIKNIPNYFKGYKTTIHFISREEMIKNHSSDPHGGTVIARTFNEEEMQLAQFKLQLANNPEFTARCTLRAAIAAVNKRRKGETGAFLESHISQEECFLHPLEERGKHRNDFI